jgi:hypothetical protein
MPRGAMGLALASFWTDDRDAMAWPVIAVAKAPQGECARVRFRAGGNEIEGLSWFDWFDEAKFLRIS